MSGFDDPRYIFRNDNQTVRHILQDCPLYHDLRSTTWVEERRKEPGGGGFIEWWKMLSHPPFAQKAAQFKLKPGLLGQFEDLKGEPMGQKSRIKPPYKVKDEAILPESLHHKITSSKTHAGPDDPCADSAAIVNVHRLATYRPPWLTE